MSAERKYTLQEAQRALARAECDAHGHSWQVLENALGPVEVFCDRCGVKYAVIRPTAVAV